LFGEWHEADLWIDRIFNFKRTDDRRDLQYAARIWSLANYYELKFDNMDKHIQAIAKYLKANEQYTATNQYILQAFRDLCKAIDRKERLSIWQALEKFLAQKITEQKQTTRQLGLEELQIWCKAKLQRTTMAEIIRMEL